MKRNGLLFVALLLLGVLSLCLVVCDEEPHVHEYKIQTSETMHWLKCDCGDTKDYNVHSGGTATCVEKAKCSVCGERHGELGDHSYEEWKTNNNSTHSKTCIYDSTHVITENCSGGTATEEERATCEVCNGKYGSPLNHTHNFNKQEVKETYLKSKATCEERAVYYYSCSCGEKGNTTFEVGETLGHAYGDWISNGDNTHTKTCSNDNTHVVTENCSGGTATCVEKAECSVCGETYGELGEHNYGVWTSNNNGSHSKVCSYESSHVITENCSGGTATCTTKAVCDDCNTSYGQLEPHVFDKEVVEEKYLKSKATCTEKAKYYYSCSCGAVSTETFEFGEVISCNYLEGVCEWCSEPEPSSTEGLIFRLINNDLEYEVSEYNSSSTEVYIASTHNGKTVTSIGERAFYGRSLTSVTIGNSVTSIASDAFEYCTSLTSVTIGNSVTSIGDGAFGNCYSLTSVTIGNSVTSIGDGAFSGCDSLTSVTIPDSVTSIGDGAFSGCDSLTRLSITNGQ